MLLGPGQNVSSSEASADGTEFARDDDAKRPCRETLPRGHRTMGIGAEDGGKNRS